MDLPELLIATVEELGKIPGVGKKTALRQALYLSKWSAVELSEFGLAIKNLGLLKRCSKCGLFADEEFCSICLSHKRGENGILCVVEGITDCLAIERSEQFFGRYHILGGVLNPLMGVGPEELGIEKLKNRVKNESIKEIILAVNPSVEGDATCSYINQVLNDTGVHIDRIGFGIPMGGTLEHLDAMTITKALENRKEM